MRSIFQVRGKDSEKLLRYVFTNEPPQLGEVSSALMLTKKGNIFGSLDLFHQDQYRYYSNVERICLIVTDIHR